ncbi:major capsid protein [Pelosinus fermentans]|uniref:Major capsid protein E n=1 Tax=Pelosinus fermentans JBW45 TaxID=1192197 RepID=I9NM83_9FIRM|nr:major capsid protein [Pelosinus fermentans]AJQ26913.1 major capsid protein E [Pelosinus fermentans JBW45]
MILSDIVNAEQIGSYWDTLQETGGNTDPFLGAALFPARKQLGLQLSWIKGASGLPVSLAPAAFDAKAPIRDRIGVSKIETEMPFFREAMSIKERDRQDINIMLSAANSALLEPIVRKIYDDAAELIRGAIVVPERMIMQLLSTGKISIASAVNALTYDYDYKLKAAQKKAITVAESKWSAVDTATPVTDIIGWQDNMEELTGVRPIRAICTRKTWGYLLSNKQIRLDIQTNGTTVVTDSILRNYLFDKVGISVSVYSKKFRIDNDTSKSYFPDNVFTLIPSGNLGNTYFGTTPEESDLMTGNNAAAVRIVNTGIAITTYQEVHPVNTNTVVSEIVLPSFEQGDKVLIATVA